MPCFRRQKEKTKGVDNGGSTNFAARRRITLPRAKKSGRRERISPSGSRAGVHLRLCFSRGSNEDLPLLLAFSTVTTTIIVGIGVKNLPMPGGNAKSQFRQESRG
jgi:hypothetical protein